MATAKINNTTRKTEVGFAYTMKSANRGDFPLVYQDSAWDVVTEGSDLEEILDGGGQYDQHTINEALATAIKNGTGSGPLPSGLLKIIGTVTVSGTKEDPETHETVDKTLADCLDDLSATSDTGDIYLYFNASENQTEEWCCIKTTTESGGVTTTTTRWELVGVKQELNATATLVTGETDEYEITFS